MNANPDGPMTGKPLPGVTKKVQRLLRTRQKAEQMIERLIAILDEMDGEAALEPNGDADEPTLGGGIGDGECEPSLGWTEVINQASRHRLGDSTTFGVDGEKDDADDEDSDPGEESDEGELEPDAELNGDEMDGNLAGTTSEVEAAYSPSLQYVTRLRKRRGQPSYHRTEHGFHNVGPLIPVPEPSFLLRAPLARGNDESITIIYPDGRRQDFDRLGYPVATRT
jgi:hypothetical protein